MLPLYNDQQRITNKQQVTAAYAAESRASRLRDSPWRAL
jgi:hypothetical protein